MKGFKREDDYKTRRKIIENLSNDELKEKFWSLTGEIVDPLLSLADEYTSPSVERSVLLRMGLSSLEANDVVEACIDRGLLGYGAGHVVYLASKISGLGIREAAIELIEGKYWDVVKEKLEE